MACDEPGSDGTNPNLAVDATVMTYNIRIISLDDNDEGNGWDVRKAQLVDMIDRYDPDILGMQEDMTPQQAYIFSRMNPEYAYVDGPAFNDALKARHSIYYKKSDYKLLRKEKFWLSETPDVISKGWDANENRICLYARLQHKASGKIIHVFNTHFDHIGSEARKNSALLVVERIKQYTDNDTGARVIFMGDLNATNGSGSGLITHNNLKTYLHDAQNDSPSGLEGPNGTFSGFDGSNVATNRIDYIYYRNLAIIRYKHIDEKLSNGRYPSDHIPVLAEVRY